MLEGCIPSPHTFIDIVLLIYTLDIVGILLLTL